MKKKLPPYAGKILQREAQGHRIDLVVIAVDDWERGKAMECADVARAVVPVDMDIGAVRLDWLEGRDVLFTPDGARALQLAANSFTQCPASLWLESDGQISRLCKLPSGSVVVDGLWFGINQLRERVSVFHEVSLLTATGIYAGRQFDGARKQFMGGLGLA